MGFIEKISFLLNEIGNLNPHTCIIAMGLINKLLVLDEGMKSKLTNIILSNTLKEKLINLNEDKIKSMTVLIERALGAIDKILQYDQNSSMDLTN